MRIIGAINEWLGNAKPLFELKGFRGCIVLVIHLDVDAASVKIQSQVHPTITV